MSRFRFVVYFCALSALCVTAFGQWVPQMPASAAFPIDLEGHTVPLDPATGMVVLPPDGLSQSPDGLFQPPAPEADAVWANVARRHALMEAAPITVAALPR